MSRSQGLPSSTPSHHVCHLSPKGTGVEAVLTLRGERVGVTHVGDVSEERLLDMIERHRTSFEPGWALDPFHLWSSESERHLAEVHELVVRPVTPLLDGVNQLELVIDGPVLTRLPWETANQSGQAALFERAQVHRGCGRTRPMSSARRFRFEFVGGDDAGLESVAPEGLLAASSYRASRREPATERMIHIAGHDPALPLGITRPSEAAHVVLSGCSSLPSRLQPGVVSVTASLWPIDDETNPITMSLFHARVASGIGPLEALRQTQLLQRAKRPAVWAGYVHLGAPN